MRALNWLGVLLIAIGCGCLIAGGVSLIDAASFQRAAGEELEHRLIAAGDPVVDDGLIGRLEIPRLRMSAIVLDGDDDATLARAVGLVHGTARPWEAGNTVLAGHRDSFFRPLRDVREGDAIRMTTLRGTFDYTVVSTQIVEPDDLSVLAPASGRSLTLVTCYPFVYVGRAPKRFIVHARRQGGPSADLESH